MIDQILLLLGYLGLYPGYLFQTFLVIKIRAEKNGVDGVTYPYRKKRV